MTLSEKLVVLRKLKGITQDEFASAVGVSRQAVYKWESGQSYPEVPKLLEMKLLFGVSIDDLLDDSFSIELPQKKKRKRLSKEAKENIEKSVSSTGSSTLGHDTLAKTAYTEKELRAAAEKEVRAEKKAQAQEKKAVAAAAPAPKAAPVVEEKPAPAPAPVVEEAPAPAPAPVVEEAPAPAPTPVVEEAPAPAAAPVVEEAPAPAPVAEEAPAPAPAPVAEEAPAAPAEEEKKEENTKKRGFFGRLFGR